MLEPVVSMRLLVLGDEAIHSIATNPITENTINTVLNLDRFMHS